MHIHKIESNKEKHKDFLLQERIDPITGDLIEENDEVVFCANCKSVFLTDTWLYLNGKHCEQSETLEEFPSSSSLSLKAEETILFYQTLSNSSTNQSKIPKKAKEKPWMRKQTKISSIQNFFHHPLVTSTKILMWVIGMTLFFVYNSPFVVFAFLLTFILKISEIVHNWYFGNQSDSVYKLFKSNTFYITNKSICFSEAYGINRYILSAENIKEIVFDESGYLDLAYCKIYYNEKGKNKEIHFSLPQGILQTSNSFIDSLKSITGAAPFPIHVRSKSKSLASHIRRLINEGNSNFTLERLKIEKL